MSTVGEKAKTSELVIPSHWKPLPATARWEDEIEWVHGNRGQCIKRTAAGSVTIDLFKAFSEAPSHGALGLLVMAGDDPKVFNNLLLSVKKAASEADGDAEAEKGTRWVVGEVRKMIEALGGKAAG